MSADGLDLSTGENVPMARALEEARLRPWLYRLAPLPRWQLQMIAFYGPFYSPLYLAATRALLLDQEAERAQRGRGTPGADQPHPAALAAAIPGAGTW
jgi:hypothetical protein